MIGLLKKIYVWVCRLVTIGEGRGYWINADGDIGFDGPEQTLTITIGAYYCRDEKLFTLSQRDIKVRRVAGDKECNWWGPTGLSFKYKAGKGIVIQDIITSLPTEIKHFSMMFSSPVESYRMKAELPHRLYKGDDITINITKPIMRMRLD